MFGELPINHFTNNVFVGDGKALVNSCFEDVFHIIEKGLVISGKLRQLKKKKKSGKKLIDRIMSIMIDYMQNRK